MKHLSSSLSWSWRLLIGTLAHVLGAMLGGGLVNVLGLEMPRFPGELEATRQLILMFPAGLVMAAGLTVMARGMAGLWWERWLLLTAFGFIINGIGNGIEASVFTTLGGNVTMALATLPAFAACALAVSLLFAPRGSARFADQVASFLALQGGGRFLRGCLLAIVAFPLVYFFFGLLISPIVVPHYETLDFLVIPPMTALLPVLLLRSALLLLASMLVLAGWVESRKALIIGLGLGHFVVVGFAGLIQATFFPAALRWGHSVEILADSLVYAWILVRLFWHPLEERVSGPAVLEARA